MVEALNDDPDRLNICSGAIALGYVPGASDEKLMAMLIHGLCARGIRYGLQAMCEVGGVVNVKTVEAL
ncbi:hypothetical protein GCM10011614_32410 [Novosphingobium colocasiae]|uniref:Thiolase C-terminal domain-containing protein n=1 Tax=Novosphingobium colocasiae TaxID=1256513 RepID=A0A918UJV6_9SPHN|nr:hypothetical protein GCM10011614_32410 [Novosphingobium colocasiae]